MPACIYIKSLRRWTTCVGNRLKAEQKSVHTKPDREVIMKQRIVSCMYVRAPGGCALFNSYSVRIFFPFFNVFSVIFFFISKHTSTQKDVFSYKHLRKNINNYKKKCIKLYKNDDKKIRILYYCFNFFTCKSECKYY